MTNEFEAWGGCEDEALVFKKCKHCGLRVSYKSRKLEWQCQRMLEKWPDCDTYQIAEVMAS